jgi:SAM-dependent methyltransferase
MNSSLKSNPAPILVSFAPPTLSRYRSLFKNTGGISILRCLEYEKLSTLGLTGRVLDFGGGSIINYSDEIPSWADADCKFTYESANIDVDTKPTFLIKEDGKIPVEDNSFDTVLSLNTFEHIFDLATPLNEIYRVLKPGGKLFFTVPFIFRVHGHPDDYIRGTPSYWAKKLEMHQFVNTDFESLNWGPFSTGLTVSGIPGPLKKLRKRIALILDIYVYSKHRKQLHSTTAPQDSPICNSPIGFFISSHKV